MLKRDELSDPNSCLNKAGDDEFVFVLLERDKATPAGIRGWIEERVRLKMNRRSDRKLIEADRCAALIEAMHGSGPEDMVPTNTRIIRGEDMNPRGYLCVIVQDDGDVVISVVADPDEGFPGSIEFCMPMTGGGRSSHTHKALRELALAMVRDNEENPIPRRGT